MEAQDATTSPNSIQQPEALHDNPSTTTDSLNFSAAVSETRSALVENLYTEGRSQTEILDILARERGFELPLSAPNSRMLSSKVKIMIESEKDIDAGMLNSPTRKFSHLWEDSSSPSVSSLQGNAISTDYRYHHPSTIDVARNNLELVNSASADIMSPAHDSGDAVEGGDIDEDAPTIEDEVTLEGGLGSTSEIAELVRWRNRKGISLRTGLPYEPFPGVIRQYSTMTDEEIARSMARRKKDYIPRIVEMSCSHPDCDKDFHRKSDLAKHEKTHSRPFKCPFETCKYHELGLPTEKEKDRHVNDQHDPNPMIYHCSFCDFRTKRESNCKQHMEKKHNWEYTREERKEKQIDPDHGSAQTSARTATDRSLEHSHQTLDGDGNRQLDHWLSNLDSLSHEVDPSAQELEHDEMMLKGRSLMPTQSSRNNDTTRLQWSMLKTGIVDGDHEGSTLVHSQAPSVLSFPTIASTNTAYSISDLISATRELIQMFTRDEFFRPLYLEAINDAQIDGERMARNFGRLLTAYGVGLKEEAEDSLQHTAARFVQHRAKHVARSIQQAFERELGKSAEQVPTNARNPIGALNDGDESDEDQARYLEDSVGTLLPIIDFLRGGGAFQRLKEDFQTFIRPHVHSRLQFQNQEQAMSTSDELPMDLTSPNALGSTEVHSRLKTLGSAWPMQWPSTLFQLRVGLGEVSLLEPLVKEKHQRIRWTCKCGTKLYDDYRELQTGALATLQQRLLGQYTSSPVKHGTDQSTTPASYCGGLRTMFTHLKKSLFGSKTSGKGSCLPQHNLQTTASSASPLASTLVNDAPYLLACIRAEHQSNKLHHNPVGWLQFDRDLFVALKTNYMRQRGRLFNLFSLQKLVGVHFVKFGVLQTEYVDIRRHFSSCQSACMCLPPKEKIDQAEYECTPVPPEVSPPIGPNLMTHLMSNPCCVPAKQTWMLKQMPKKLKGRLEGKLNENVTGWGLHFDEGLNWTKIWTILFVVFVLGSLSFAILWSVYRFDIQGAFGVASWWISLCTVLLGILATKDMSS